MVLVKDGIHLCMAHVGILRLEWIALMRLLGPRQLVVLAATRKPIVTNTQNDLVLADYAGANLHTTVTS